MVISDNIYAMLLVETLLPDLHQEAGRRRAESHRGAGVPVVRQPRRSRRAGEEGGRRRRQPHPTRRRTMASCTAMASRTSTATCGNWCTWTRHAGAAAGLEREAVDACTRPRTRRSTRSGASSPRRSSPCVARMVRDVGVAEELAQDALVAALEHWPREGVPDNPAPGSWPPPRTARSTGCAARRCCTHKHERDRARPRGAGGADRARLRRRARCRAHDEIGDDLLRLIFTACHPVLLDRGARRADAQAAGRADHARDRARLPGARADDRAAHRARQAHARRGPRAVRGAARARAGTSGWLGAGGRLPGLQRGLHGDGGRRLDAAGAGEEALRLGRMLAELAPQRAGGAWLGGADGAAGVAHRRRASTRRAARCCWRTRTARAGTTC